MINLSEINNVAIFVRILLSVFIGGLIGLERESQNQPAGGRTYTLVCLGACLVMMTNQYICEVFQCGDPSRLGAQVVSGIGFLGAGTILVTRNNQVRGLTTAAGLWSAACIGLAIGIGFYSGAIAAAAALLVVMTVFKKLDNRVRRYSKYIRLYLTFSSEDGINDFMKKCQEEQMVVIDMQIMKSKKEGKRGISAMFTLKSNTRYEHNQFISKFASNEEISYIAEV